MESMGAGSMKCEEFLSKLELLPVEAPGTVSAEEWGEHLPGSAREHLSACASCAGALEDFAETRSALGAMKETLPEPGPWFASRVMATIRAQERAIEEQKDGFWVSVMKLAPKLAAFGALLLVLGGTWALQLRKAEETQQTQQTQMRSQEGIFENSPSTPFNDDIVASSVEERQR